MSEPAAKRMTLDEFRIPDFAGMTSTVIHVVPAFLFILT